MSSVLKLLVMVFLSDMVCVMIDVRLSVFDVMMCSRFLYVC